MFLTTSMVNKKAYHSKTLRYENSISSTNVCMLCLLVNSCKYQFTGPRPDSVCYSFTSTLTCRLQGKPLRIPLNWKVYRGAETQSRLSSALTGLKSNMKTWIDRFTRVWLLGCILPERLSLFRKIFFLKLCT